jgi:hypothetical protein
MPYGGASNRKPVEDPDKKPERKGAIQMAELFGTKTERQELEREAGERVATPQTAGLITVTIILTVRLRC